MVGLPGLSTQEYHSPVGTAVSAHGVSRSFRSAEETVTALGEVELAIGEGEFIAFVGPSGCGKTTLLNIVAGLIPPTTGQVYVHGQRLQGPNVGVGYMTQRDSLLPWRTVRRNVALGLELRGGAKTTAAKDRVEHYLSLVGLAGFGGHWPAQLSGGMRKRVGLAQLLVYEPDMLLMDEPFGSLDAILKLVMQKELLKLVEGTGKTVLFVTHDVEEAISVADRILVFSASPGRIKSDITVSIDRPRDVTTVRQTKEFSRVYSRVWADLAEEVGFGADARAGMS